jgi:hypothetical protein
MRCEIGTYAHASNGITLYVVPETDAEHELLMGLWKHGAMELVDHPASDTKYGRGFAVTWSFREVRVG